LIMNHRQHFRYLAREARKTLPFQEKKQNRGRNGFIGFVNSTHWVHSGGSNQTKRISVR
jgi:hypothetical protein